MSQLDLKIGPKIKAFRRQLGLQANKLAEDLNISPSYLNLIEGGKRKIDGDLLLKICEKLNIELSQLTSKTDVNLENTLSEILDDKLFEDLDILGPIFRFNWLIFSICKFCKFIFTIFFFNLQAF